MKPCTVFLPLPNPNCVCLFFPNTHSNKKKSTLINCRVWWTRSWAQRSRWILPPHIEATERRYALEVNDRQTDRLLKLINSFETTSLLYYFGPIYRKTMGKIEVTNEAKWKQKWIDKLSAHRTLRMMRWSLLGFGRAMSQPSTLLQEIHILFLYQLQYTLKDCNLARNSENPRLLKPEFLFCFS